MKKFYALLLAGVCVCLSFQQARATPENHIDFDWGKEAAVLLLLTEPGARAIAMGESYVAISDDATVNYFNPATLAGQTKKLLNFTHSEFNPMLNGNSRRRPPINYKFLAYAQPVYVLGSSREEVNELRQEIAALKEAVEQNDVDELRLEIAALLDSVESQYLKIKAEKGWGNIGLNIALLNFGWQWEGEAGKKTLVSIYDVAVSAAYGSEITANMSVGIGLKFIRSRSTYGTLVGNSFATDLGLLWKISPTMTFGTALRNLGPKIALIGGNHAEPLPQHIVAGLAYKALDTEFNDLLLSVDLYKPLIADGSFASNLVKAWADEPLGDEFKMDLHVGGEYKYGLSSRQDESFFAMRGGYSLDRDGESKVWTVGVGLRYNMFQVDVAYYGSPKRQQEKLFAVWGIRIPRVLKSDHFCFALTLLL